MRVCEYFAGKHIFITGGSGFVGKVLIEKLLRSCPGIEKIYMLIRPKKGKDIQERLEAIVKLPLFEKLREINPDALSKIHPISGDVMELNLGMTEEDRRLVSENCHIFYHSAASVRFDDSLKYAIIMNVRGTRETAALALECKKLEAFVHISTTYCNIDREIIEEKIYPARADWRDAIRLAEETDDMNLQALTHHYIAPHPNTYTFAKSLAEHTVEDMMLGKAPTIIFRPSVGKEIVVSTSLTRRLYLHKSLNVPQLSRSEICNSNQCDNFRQNFCASAFKNPSSIIMFFQWNEKTIFLR
ncbi:unnamed protein product [Acanthoscelides obtectus]|uniref:Fatty acyl-CoA reductase n=1 Tax=Acanthoscelides obtectus TaxID=200917 RepID=A0A9P0Q361_ACAOB|nr:unnamed protein product [Acanthoscelides obtectus]CAK1645879.1 Putative fatty acyl-CoA reductase CG5065 [Acanthoscelides obtectus]